MKFWVYSYICSSVYNVDIICLLLTFIIYFSFSAIWWLWCTMDSFSLCFSWSSFLDVWISGFQQTWKILWLFCLLFFFFSVTLPSFEALTAHILEHLLLSYSSIRLYSFFCFSQSFLFSIFGQFLLSIVKLIDFLLQCLLLWILCWTLTFLYLSIPFICLFIFRFSSLCWFI